MESIAPCYLSTIFDQKICQSCIIGSINKNLMLQKCSYQARKVIKIVFSIEAWSPIELNQIWDNNQIFLWRVIFNKSQSHPEKIFWNVLIYLSSRNSTEFLFSLSLDLIRIFFINRNCNLIQLASIKW